MAEDVRTGIQAHLQKNCRKPRHMPTFSGAPRPVRRIHVGRSPGSRVKALFLAFPGSSQWHWSEKRSPPTVAGAASVDGHAAQIEFPLSDIRIPTSDR